MKNISIYKNNAFEAGALLGEEVKEKGYELYTFARYAGSATREHYPIETVKKNINSIFNRANLDNCFVYKLTRVDTNGIKTTFEINEEDLKEVKLSKERYPIKETLEKFLNDESITYIEVYANRFLGYMDLSKYDTSLESQVEFVKEIYKLKGYKGVTDNIEYGDEELMYISSNLGNDSKSIHNRCVYVNDKIVEKFDGRIYNFNETAIDKAWEILNSDPFKDIDPNYDIVVWHRKEKDFYITPAMDYDALEIEYLEDNEYIIDNVDIYYNLSSNAESIVSQAIQILKNIKRKCEVSGYIYNNLLIGNYSDGFYNEIDSSAFNIDILKKEYGSDIYEAANAIYSFIDWSSVGNEEYNVEEIVGFAYEKFLEASLDNKDRLFGKYKHLSLLKKIVSNKGCELVHSDTKEIYKVKCKNATCSFSLFQLYKYPPKLFFRNIIEPVIEKKSTDTESDE